MRMGSVIYLDGVGKHLTCGAVGDPSYSKVFSPGSKRNVIA